MINVPLILGFFLIYTQCEKDQALGIIYKVSDYEEYSNQKHNTYLENFENGDFLKKSLW